MERKAIGRLRKGYLMGKLRIVFVLGVRMVGGRMVLGRRKVKENNEGWDGNR